MDSTEKNIEDIEIGELVLSLNEKKFIVESDTVRNITHFKSKKIIKMLLQDSTEIEFTEDHPFWIVGKGWSVYNVNKAVRNNIRMEVQTMKQGDFVLV